MAQVQRYLRKAILIFCSIFCTCSFKVDRFRQVASIWDNFQMQMDSHEAVVSKQVESIKLNLNSQVNNLNSDVEKFQLR